MEPGKLFDTPSIRSQTSFIYLDFFVSRKLESYKDPKIIDLKCMHVLQSNSVSFLASCFSVHLLLVCDYALLNLCTIIESLQRCYALPLFIVLVPKSSSLLKCHSISLLSAQNVHNHDDFTIYINTRAKFEWIFPVYQLFCWPNLNINYN